jgi:hypothetical protein
MARGKHLSLEEARRKGLLKQFAKENPLEGDMDCFNRLLDAMAKGEPPDSAARKRKPRTRTSARGSGGD